MSNDDNRNSAYNHPNQNPDNFIRWSPQHIQEYKEKVYDAIAKLLIENFSLIEKFLPNSGIESLQKTYRGGELVTGRNLTEMIVLYESDVDAVSNQNDIEDTILKWLSFADPETIKLSISGTDGGLPNLELYISNDAENKFNINGLLGSPDGGIKDIVLKDAVSQFLGMEQVKTNTDRSKILENVDTDFSELSPITFTQLLEKYNKYKKDIPLYRYRSDDFFNEYGNSIIPVEYRIEKFFDEFERIKDNIPAGSLETISSTTSRDRDSIFGWRTMTYLLKASRLAIDDGNVPEWSTDQVSSFWETIDNLTESSQSLVIDRDYWRDLYNKALDTVNFVPAIIGPEVITHEVEVSFDEVEELEAGCMDPTALNYDPARNYTFDYCLSPTGHESQTECKRDEDCDLVYQPTMEAGGAIAQADINMYDLTGDRVLDQADIDMANSIGMSSIGSAIGNLIAGKEANTDFKAAVKQVESKEYETYVRQYIPGWSAKPKPARTNWTCNSSCIYEEKESGPEPESGCMDPSAINYDVVKNVLVSFDYCKSPDGLYVSETHCVSDGECVISHNEDGWTCNGSCEYGVGISVQPIPPRPGCTDDMAENYNNMATEDDGSCIYNTLFETSFDGGSTPCLPPMQLWSQRTLYSGLVEEKDDIYEKYTEGEYERQWTDPRAGGQGYRGMSNGLNTAIEFGPNPGDSDYVLMQDGWISNECEIIVPGIQPSTQYALTAWVSYNESYNGLKGAGTFTFRADSSKGTWGGGSFGDQPGTLIETKMVNGRTWHKYRAYITTANRADMGTGHWSLGYINEGKHNTNVPLYDKDCTTDLSKCAGRRYYTGLKLQRRDKYDKQHNLGTSTNVNIDVSHVPPPPTAPVVREHLPDVPKSSPDVPKPSPDVPTKRGSNRGKRRARGGRIRPKPFNKRGRR
jgi:hypothetical protein